VRVRVWVKASSSIVMRSVGGRLRTHSSTLTHNTHTADLVIVEEEIKTEADGGGEV